MLGLTRNIGESLEFIVNGKLIGTLHVVDVDSGHQVHLGLDFSRDVIIKRSELRGPFVHDPARPKPPISRGYKGGNHVP
jgi:sRNA-binding carbon storage regulator CsrA